MNNQYGHVEVYVLERTNVWVERMGLAHWQIETIFLNTQLVDEPIVDDFLITASTESRWNYLQAKIKWYLPSAIRHSDKELEATVVHELCHVALAPEQDLLEVKLEQIAADETGDNSLIVMRMYFERLELATETMARCLLKAWA